MSERWLKQAYIPDMEPLITQYCRDINTKLEDNLVFTVEKAAGFHVDRDRLLQALTDDRAFYEEGYRAAMRESEWISVEERLPMLHTDVLVYRRSLCRTGGYQAIDYVTVGLGEVLVWSSDYLSWNSEVTHWMHLPEPPVVTDTNVGGKKRRGGDEI